jgi:hypothetical protein
MGKSHEGSQSASWADRLLSKTPKSGGMKPWVTSGEGCHSLEIKTAEFGLRTGLWRVYSRGSEYSKRARLLQ